MSNVEGRLEYLQGHLHLLEEEHAEKMAAQQKLESLEAQLRRISNNTSR